VLVSNKYILTEERGRARKEFHTSCCLDKIKQAKKKEKREATVDVVIPDITAFNV